MNEIDIYPPSRQKTLEWITALSAEGIEYRLDRDRFGWILYVTEDLEARAREAIEGYEKDNIDWPPKPVLKPIRVLPVYDNWTAFGIALLLAVFFIWLGPHDPNRSIMQAGSASSVGIRAGEWWRIITAMTLHSGFPHLAGNIIFMVVLGHFVCRRMGSGLGAMLILVSGASANLAGAWWWEAPHNAVGASTACFGALGLLSTEQAITRLRTDGDWHSIFSRIWIPLGAAFALLSFTGTSPGSDLAGHLFGFLFGLVYAIPFSLFGTRKIPEWLQRTLELGSLLLVLAAWKVAFNTVGG